MNDLIKSMCFQELHKYTKEEIFERLNKDVVKKLENYKFIEIKDDAYQFNYVGILIINDTVIYSYPKSQIKLSLKNNKIFHKYILFLIFLLGSWKPI